MRSQLDIIQQIEQFILGTMDASAIEQFETSIAQSTELQDLVDFQRLQIHASKRAALKLEIKSFTPPARKSFWNKLRSIFGGGLLVAGIIAAFSGFKANEDIPEIVAEIETTSVSIPDNTRSYQSKVEPNSPVTKRKSNLTTIYDRNTSVSYDSSSAEHFSWLPLKEEHFFFDAQDGGIFEGDEGVLIVVPEDALLTKDGEVAEGEIDFQLIEILKMEDIIAYNLATMNGKNPLSSGGMVKVLFEKDGEELVINPARPLSIEIPTSNYNPDMKIWEGIEEDGIVDWQNSTPLKKTLTIVDLDLLDFLPAEFEDAVYEILPYHGHDELTKDLVDSIYFSLSEIEENNIPGAPGYYQPSKKIYHTYAHIETVKPNSSGRDASKPLQNVKIAVYENDRFYCNVHTNGEGVIEIDLKGKKERKLKLVPAIPGSDPRPQTINFRKGVKPTIVFESLKDDEEIEFVNQLTKRTNAPGKSNSQEYCFIDPNSIRTILDVEFQQTFIATKEFEERIAVIHSLANGDGILATYVTNLDQPLWKCDQLASNQLSGSEREIFRKFEAQQLTNVENDGINQRDLSAYYDKKRQEYAIARNAERKMYQRMTDREIDGLQEDLVDKLNSSLTSYETTGEQHNAEKEWAVLYRKNVSTAPSYAFDWSGGAWINCDSYLAGMFSSLEEVEISVDQSPDDLVVYQCINSTKSLITLSNSNDTYQAKFPVTRIADDTYCLAISKLENGFLYGQQVYKPGETPMVKLELQEVTAAELKSKLVQLDPGNIELVQQLDREDKLLKKEKKSRARASQLDQQITDLIDQQKIEVAYRKLLKEVISTCGLSQIAAN